MKIKSSDPNVNMQIGYPEWYGNYTGDWLLKGVDGALGCNLYSTVPLLYQLVQIRCDAITALPFKIKDGQGKELFWSDLFPETDFAELLWLTEASWLLHGRAFWEITRNRYGIIKGVKFINPYSMTVAYSKGVYTFNQVLSDGTERKFVNDENVGRYEMVYFREYNPTDDIQPGKGAAEVGGISALLMREIVRFPQSYLQGGATPVTLLGFENLSPEQVGRVETWIQNAFSTVRSYGKRILGLSDTKVTPTVLTPPLKQTVLPELETIARKSLITAIRVPESMIYGNAANFATAQEDRKSFYEDTVEPHANNKLASVFNRMFLHPYGRQHGRGALTCKFDKDSMSLFQDDEKDRLDKAQSLRNIGMPLVMALDVAGIEITEEQRTELETFVDETPTVSEAPAEQAKADKSQFEEDLERWQRKAAKAVKAGKSANVPFESDKIPAFLKAAIEPWLEAVESAEDLARVFETAMDWRGYP